MSCFSDIYFWRQSIVLIADSLYSLNTGFMLSFPALLNAAILSPNTTDIKATQDQASSIAGCQGLAGVVGFCLLPVIMQSMGRKSVHIGINVLVGIGFLIFAFATDIPALYAARLMQGLPICGVYVTTMMIAEYSDAKRRGYFITIKKGSVAIGSLICHSMGIYWTWRQVAAFAIIPNLIAIIMTFFWPESPSYLAMKGRFEECEKSYQWLHGNGSDHMKHLEEIISAQRKRRLEDKKNKKRLTTTILRTFRKDYVIPFLIVSLLTLIIDCSGRYYIVAYIVQIVIDITGDKSIATICTLGSDVLTVVALICSCFVINAFKRRVNLFSFGIMSLLLMYLTSIILFLRSKYQVEVNVWLTPVIIIINVFIVNVGVIPICFAVIGEIFPLEHKGSGLCTTGIVFTMLYSGVMKFTPIMMEKTGVEGTFAIYATLNFISLLILYFILIETKDKTLQDIENQLKGIKKQTKLYSHPNEQPLIQSY